MDIKEKLALEQPCAAGTPGLIRLHKEGKFLVAYNESAVLLRRDFWPKLKMIRVSKKDGTSYLRAGFPLESTKAVSFLPHSEISQSQLVELPVSSGLGLEFDLSSVEVDKVISRSVVGDSSEGKVDKVALPDSGQESVLRIVDELSSVDPLRLTPLESLNLVCRWRGIKFIACLCIRCG